MLGRIRYMYHNIVITGHSSIPCIYPKYYRRLLPRSYIFLTQTLMADQCTHLWPEPYWRLHLCVAEHVCVYVLVGLWTVASNATFHHRIHPGTQLPERRHQRGQRVCENVIIAL